MYSELLPKARYTGQEYWWTLGETKTVYVVDTVRPVDWKMFNLSVTDERRDYEEFKRKCSSLRY